MPLKVLSALDSAKIQSYYFKGIVVVGMGLFTDAYDLFCIPPIMKLLSSIYYKDQEIPAVVSFVVVGTTLLGTIVGQLFFGHLGDRVGRQRMYGLCLVLMVLSSICCGLSMGTSRAYVLCSLGFFRFILGVGIDGDYPLSATIMSEFANRRTRGAFIAAVFSMQGFGIVMSSTVTLVVCAIFDCTTMVPLSSAALEVVDLAWRLILMIGAVPVGYTALVEKNVEQAAKDMQKLLSISLSQIAEEEEEEQQELSPNTKSSNNVTLFSKQFFRRHGRDLFSCAAAWFLVDIIFYSSNLFQSQMFSHYLQKHKKLNPFQEAFQLAKFQSIIAICSTIPGYYATVYFIYRVGRVKIQIMGFLFMGLALLSVGIPYNVYWRDKTNIGFMILYSLTFFFSNFGPNTTTFIVPAELFLARFRSTCHGISGAAGKAGVIIGSVWLLWVLHGEKENDYINGIRMTALLVMLGGVCILGMIVTYFFTGETMGRSLEENENGDEMNGMCFLRCITDPCVGQESSRGNV